MQERHKTRIGPQVGQLVMIKRNGSRGFEDVAWGTVVEAKPGKPSVRIEGCIPDRFSGHGAYEIGDVVEVRRADGLVAVPTRHPII